MAISAGLVQPKGSKPAEKVEAKTENKHAEIDLGGGELPILPKEKEAIMTSESSLQELQKHHHKKNKEEPAKPKPDEKKEEAKVESKPAESKQLEKKEEKKHKHSKEAPKSTAQVTTESQLESQIHVIEGEIKDEEAKVNEIKEELKLAE